MLHAQERNTTHTSVVWLQQTVMLWAIKQVSFAESVCLKLIVSSVFQHKTTL